MLSVLIPCYNEADSIQQTVEQLRRVLDATGVVYEVIVIDDGSKDETAALAEAAGVRVIRHPKNGGYGRALKSGMYNAAYEWCAIVDADGSYPIDRFPDLLQFVPAFDMVVAARTGLNYWGSPYKRISRIMLLKLVSFVTGVNVPDANSGMRVFRKDVALAHVRRISSGFSFTTTLTLALLMEEHFVHYVSVDYYKRVGKSKVRLGIDSLRTFQIITQAVLFYNPLKVFLPICIACVTVGAALGLLELLAGSGLALLMFGMSLLAALVVGAVGFLAETIRLHRVALTQPQAYRRPAPENYETPGH